ncbi:TPA: hypothetical protein F7139_03290 [Legionella pneumophila]|nr:hypothetical protein [Legionella pneumophila]
MAEKNEIPSSSGASKIGRAALQTIGGAVPLLGGGLSAIAGYWSEKEQEKANKFYEHWLGMLEDELREQYKTVIEIMARLDLQDKKIVERIESPEYQSLMKKAFRDWSGAESEDKRVFIRNILSNSAATDLVSDDVIKLFIGWIDVYSEFHFKVISVIYNTNGITRAEIWKKLNKSPVREDSADADLFKLLIRDLSTGGVIRQFRQTDYHGRYMKKGSTKRTNSSGDIVKSAFDDTEPYELTQLGKQFVHYAMSDLPLKIEFDSDIIV